MSLLPLFCLSACKTKTYVASELPKDQLVMGSGGGITGAYNHYIFLDNGQIFKHSSLEDSTYAYKQMTKVDNKAFWEKFDSLNLKEIDFNEPGNMTFFMERKTEEGSHKVVWGGMNQPPPEKLKDFYKDTMRKLSEIKEQEEAEEE